MVNTYSVAKTNELASFEKEMKPLVVEVEGRKFGIYRFKDKYYCYENVCAHEGGAVVEGKLVGHLEGEVAKDGSGKRMGEHFSKEKLDIICPWHGIQYDLETGICTADERLKIDQIQVLVDSEGNIKLSF